MKINRIAQFINNSKTAQKLLKNINDNPAWYGALATGIFTLALRPASIGIMPFKDKKDKQYSIGSSLAAGTIELVSSALLFNPVNKAIKTASDNLYKARGTIYHNNPEILRQFKSMTNRNIKLLSLIPISFLRFSLVKPIVDTFLGGKQSKGTSVVRKGTSSSGDILELSNQLSKEVSSEDK